MNTTELFSTGHIATMHKVGIKPIRDAIADLGFVPAFKINDVAYYDAVQYTKIQCWLVNNRVIELMMVTMPPAPVVWDQAAE